MCQESRSPSLSPLLSAKLPSTGTQQASAVPCRSDELAETVAGAVASRVAAIPTILCGQATLASVTSAAESIIGGAAVALWSGWALDIRVTQPLILTSSCFHRLPLNWTAATSHMRPVPPAPARSSLVHSELRRQAVAQHRRPPCSRRISPHTASAHSGARFLERANAEGPPRRTLAQMKRPASVRGRRML